MMSYEVGVIDLGSNTFHLLIVKREEDGGFLPVFKERAFVGLAENGIELLSEASMVRGLKALQNFKEILKNRKIDQYTIIGTSALRSARNSSVFLNRVKNEIGLDIKVISGDREAELIYKGVRQLLPENDTCQVIIDVGGGSVEFIVVDKGQLEWAESYDVGVGVLFNHITMADPSSEEDITIVNQFIDQKLESLKSYIEGRTVDALVGASGSFEVVQSMNGGDISSDMMTEISLEDYHVISQRIIASTVKERMDIDGLPETRVKLIVVAMILINKAISILQPNRLLISPYALKEGVLSELRVD